jgi:hypothetical protein
VVPVWSEVLTIEYALIRRMLDPARYLDEAAQQLWADLARHEEGGLRKDALASLEQFIATVNGYVPERRAAWVEAICTEHWSVPTFPFISGKLKLRHPLLVEVVFPVLLSGYRAGRPNYARWLALFSLTRSGAVDGETYGELRLRGLPEWYPPQLLREAIRLDENDRQAALALILHLEERNYYWTHHVPIGVLTEDTAGWRRELAEFECLIERYPPGREYAFELRRWRFHCDAWEEFLQRRDEFRSYEEFLAQ